LFKKIINESCTEASTHLNKKDNNQKYKTRENFVEKLQTRVNGDAARNPLNI
jgi:hypothetical protein